MLSQVDARFRLFCVVNAKYRPKPYEQARLHQVFGFDVCDLMSQGRVRRPVSYGIVRTGGTAPDGTVHSLPTIEGQRPKELVNSLAAYTHHHARNDLICRLARKIQRREGLENRKFRDIRRWLQDDALAGRLSSPLRVTIVVDRIDHAIQLGKKLADWPIYADEESNLDDIAQSLRRRIVSRPTGWHLEEGQIVVAGSLHRFPGYCSDVVIWASGGTSIRDISTFWMFTKETPAQPLLIVDLLDDFTPITKSWSIKRMRDLESRDIFRVGTPVTQGRIERFLREQGGSRS